MAYRARDNLFSHILTDEEVDELISMWKAGHTFRDMAKYFDIHYNTVGNVINRYVDSTQRKHDVAD